MFAKDLTAQELYGWVNERMEKLRLPLPSKPSLPAPEFNFPDDPNKLTSTELGQLMLRMIAFYGYCQRLLGMADSELSLVEAEYKLKVNTNSLTVRENLNGRPAAEVVEAAVLAGNEDLTILYKRKLELNSIKIQLISRLSIYEKFHYALSRELTRRDTESRVS